MSRPVYHNVRFEFYASKDVGMRTPVAHKIMILKIMLDCRRKNIVKVEDVICKTIPTLAASLMGV